MTKKELMEMLSDQEVEILMAKKSLQYQLNECFDQNNEVLESHYKRYDELIRTFEFFNGQQSLLGNQVTMFKFNKNKYYELVDEKYLKEISKR